MALHAFPFLTGFVDGAGAPGGVPALAVHGEHVWARRYAALLGRKLDGVGNQGCIVLVLARDGRVLDSNAAGEVCFSDAWSVVANPADETPKGSADASFHANPERTTGLVGRPLGEMLAGGSAAELAVRLEATWSDGHVGPTCILEVAQRRTSLLVSLLPVIENGETIEVLFFGQDITARVENEIALSRQRDQLLQLTHRQSRELSAARDEVAAACRARSEVLANMSHELRTPMHAILSFARLGKERATILPPERLTEYFQRILESGDRLLELLGYLLDLARLEAGKVKMDCEPVDLHALCVTIARQFESQLEAKAQHLQISVPAIDTTVVGDRVRLGQVVSNLLSNAIKFTPTGGHVTIDFAAAELPAGRRLSDRDRLVPAVTMRVADDGVGIAEKDLERIFDKFFQGSRTRTGAGGTGLGLAICREIVGHHRGTIVARRPAGGGALFEVVLPCVWESS